MEKIVTTEKRMSGKMIQLENKMNALVDKSKHIILEKSKRYGTQTMYTICSYVYLCKHLGHDEAVKILLMENTDKYLDSCLNEVSNIRDLIENNQLKDLESSLFEITSTYNSKYTKAKKDFDIIVIVACIDGFDFEEFREYVHKNGDK